MDTDESSPFLIFYLFVQINVMLKEMPNEEFGPGISIREYSLFENPSMPQEVFH